MASTPRLQSSQRSASMAYPSSFMANLVAKGQYYIRRHNQVFMIAVALLVFLVLLASTDSSFPSDSVSVLRGSSTPSLIGGAQHPGYFFPQDAVSPDKSTFHFAAVTDLDELSKVETEKKPTFRSFLLSGTLTKVSGGSGSATYSIDFAREHEMRTKHNEAGRGAEFSELTLYQNRLYTFDDRTGDVFEILTKEDKGQLKPFVVPRFVITEGDGETDKGMKWEWATVKNGELYMGSMGKAFTDNKTGEIVSRNNLYVSILNNRGELRRENWTDKYDVVRKALNAMDPGYIIMEAILWSQHLRKWVFLPRRISQEAYNDVIDERKGSNKVVLVDEKFQTTTVVEIKMESMDPLKGFSTFAFVPGTRDRHAIAVRSVEEGCADDEGKCSQRSYCLVFDVQTGEVLSPEVQFPGEYKYEGIEFVKIDTKPPM